MNAAPNQHQHVVLYDGVCGLCAGFVRFAIHRDPQGAFAYLPLQDRLAERWLQTLGEPESRPDSMVVVKNEGTADQDILIRSDAALFVLGALQTRWRFLRHLRFIPRPLRNLGYRIVAALRYRLFGKKNTCDVPSAEVRARFAARSLDPN